MPYAGILLNPGKQDHSPLRSPQGHFWRIRVARGVAFQRPRTHALIRSACHCQVVGWHGPVCLDSHEGED